MPNYIGMTLQNRTRFILDLSERLYMVEDEKGRIKNYSEEQVNKNPDLRRQFDQLVTIWENERWLRHLSKKHSP